METTVITYDKNNEEHSEMLKQGLADLAAYNTLIKADNAKKFDQTLLIQPATEKQINAIINLNNTYNIKTVIYPECTYLSKALAILLLDHIYKAAEHSPKRPYSQDRFYRLYERFAAKYPENNISAPVRDYRVDTENIPDADVPVKAKGLPDPKDVRRSVANKAFMNKVMSDFMKGE